MADRIAYVLGRFPVLSETFILREIVDLQRLGLPIDLYALAHGDRGMAQPDAERLQPDVVFRPSPAGLLRPRSPTVLGALRRPGRLLREAWRLLRLGPKRPGWSLIALSRVLSACYLAGEMARRGTARVHAHFLGAPTHVGYLAARILDVPFSCSAHAADVFTRERLPEIDRVIAHYADIIFACTRFLAECLAVDHGLPSEKIAAVYHGIRADELAVARSPVDPPLILAVGRLVEKKGFAHLVSACAVLRRKGLGFRCVIVGEGPERPVLEGLIADGGMEGVVRLAGALPFPAVLEWMARASVIAAPSVVAIGGDADGLPNVLLEAAAVGLPIIASDVSGIPELVRDGQTGLLVPPHDAPALADALERVLTDATLADGLAARAREVVLTEFDSHRSAERIARFLCRDRVAAARMHP